MTFYFIKNQPFWNCLFLFKICKKKSGVFGLFFLLYQRVTLPGQVAEFFKIGDGGEEDGDPVFFVHVVGGEDGFMVYKLRDLFRVGFEVYGPDRFFACKAKVFEFDFHYKGKPFLIRAAEDCACCVAVVGPGSVARGI